MNKAVFLDRDGTMTKDAHYCSRPEDLLLLPNVGEGVSLLNENGFKVAVITNQSGIARGYFNDQILEEIHNKMRRDLARYNASVDAIYYCPHHPDEGCECRKPKPKLAYEAISDLCIDVKQSYFVGDRMMDVQVAKSIGCKSVIIANDLGMGELEKGDISPDYIATDLKSAAKWIIGDSTS